MKNAMIDVGLTISIGHRIWIKFSGRPYRRWHRKFCKGDWFVSLQLCVVSSEQNYLNIFSSTECLSIHLGAPQSANLGDGNGFVNQMVKHTSTLKFNAHRPFVDRASSKLWCCSPRHLLRESNRRKPFPVSGLHLMITKSKQD